MRALADGEGGRKGVVLVECAVARKHGVPEAIDALGRSDGLKVTEVRPFTGSYDFFVFLEGPASVIGSFASRIREKIDGVERVNTCLEDEGFPRKDA